MNIFCVLSYRCQHGNAVADVIYENAVHNVEMDMIAAAFFCSVKLFAQTAQIGAENGSRNYSIHFIFLRNSA